MEEVRGIGREMRARELILNCKIVILGVLMDFFSFIIFLVIIFCYKDYSILK